MVPIGTLVTVDKTLGPQTILRYNLYPAASITGEAAPGFSSGEALNLMEQLAKSKLPPSMVASGRAEKGAWLPLLSWLEGLTA